VFRVVIRKMLKNKWMILCLLLGLILTVALVSCIPVYTDGVLQRLLVKDLEAYQESSGVFPGKYLISANFTYDDGKDIRTKYDAIDNKVNNSLVPGVGLPVLTQTQHLSTIPLPILNLEDKNNRQITTQLAAFSDFHDHTKITHGRSFSNDMQGDTYEAVVSEEAFKNLNLIMDRTYLISDTLVHKKNSGLKVKIVGIFAPKDINQPFWYIDMNSLESSIIINFDLLKNNFVKNRMSTISKAEWYYAFDYHKIRLDKNSFLTNTLNSHVEWINKNSRLLKIDLPLISLIKQYSQRESQLKTTLLVLQVPVLLMLALYIFMISKLKIDYESNEIAVLKSRGASKIQVFRGYLIESSILGLIALLLGPPLGLILCKIIGASNGFLEFVNRGSLPVYLNFKTYLYALCAIAFFMVTMLVPSFLASRISIVLYKHEKSKFSKKIFWKKYFLDIVLVCISMYGIYGYHKHQRILFISGAKGTDVSIDPLLFIVSFTFILGFGLFFLRLYPYFIKFVFWLGKDKWSPVFYSTFIQVGRTAGQQQFLMIFLILTLSIGIFSSNTARTINKNAEEKILYATGTDIVVKEHWESNKLYLNKSSSATGNTSTLGGNQELLYYVPPFEPYTKLSGVETATKVFIQDDAGASINNQWINNISVMGIIPNEFGKVAWFRDDLLKAHWYNYLNLLSNTPNAVLVSQSVKEKYNVKEGDTIYIKWGYHDYFEAVVYAFIDYWPTFNPNKKSGNGTTPYFIVANLDYIHGRYSIEPYEVWLKKKNNASSNQIYNEIADKNINIKERKDSTEQIIMMKNDPIFQGTNGALTLDFLVTLVVCIIGFLIYWIMSIQKRVLQFGILRAMGLTLKKVLGMLLCEQILITGSSVLFGIILGNFVSEIFIPMLQLVYGSQEQLPPFKVIFHQSDYIRLYIFVGIMISIGFIVLGAIISRIKINQALKLGED